MSVAWLLSFWFDHQYERLSLPPPMATTMTRLPPISLQNLNPHVMLMPRLKAVSYLIKSTIGVPTLVPCTTPVPTAFVVLPTMLTWRLHWEPSKDKKDNNKDKGKDKDKDKEGNKSSTHPWTGGLAKSCKRAPGDGLLSPAGKSSEGCRFFSKSVEWVWGLNARFWLVHYGTLSFSAIWTSRQIISATIQY